ncbi:MAG: peptidoglycan bridge formation glycyltransferase FemA/FemB family protein [Sedimentisphaerales bacterium]|nr:peptidoglycan bridge formation glycyltransferase FemA/FemB family protein [Sedimentisphaerales bacterium]
MDVQIRPIDVEHLQGGSSLFQSGFWGMFKSHFGWTPRGFVVRFEGRERNLLVLLRRVAEGLCMAYVPYGPTRELPDESQAFFLKDLARELEPLLPDDCICLRFDLPWQSPYAAADGSDGALRPATRIREMRMNAGTGDWNLRKAPTDVLPCDTVLIDLARDEREILASMKPKTRYNVRLAERKGVEVYDAPPDELSVWYDLHEQTARRHRIVKRELEYFRELLKLNEAMATTAVDLHLLLARHAGEPVAGIIVALHGGCATYLYGASRRSKRDVMATYRLQWRAMRLARRHGCTRYDLFGIPPTERAAHPMHGLYRFKTGFGGTKLHRRGCWDYVYLADPYNTFRAIELAAEGYHDK